MRRSESASGLVVGHVAGVTLTKWRTIWADRFRRVPLDVLPIPDARARQVLDAGAADLVFARLPVDTAGLHRIVLWDEVQAVWAARDHPVALFDAVHLADLDGEVVLRHADADALARVAAGEAVLVLPQSVARQASRRDLAYRPILDAEPTAIALIWRTDNEHPLIDEFIGIVRGRTATSSRTVAERVAKGQPPHPKPRGKVTPRPTGRTGGTRRRGRRRS